jgi:hypothetical protein
VAGPETIHFEIFSWGKPLSAWTLNPNGLGEYRDMSDIPGGKFGEYRLTVRSVSAGSDGYSKLQESLEPARALSQGETPCGPRMTDLPYGQIEWRSGGEVRKGNFDTGCSSDEMRKIVSALQVADEQMKRWSGSGKVLEQREIREPSR